MVQLSHPYMTTGKTMPLTRWTFFCSVMSLFFIMPSSLVIAFLPRIKCLLTSWLQSPSAVILEPKKIKSLTVSIVSPSISHEVMGLDAMILVFECWVLSQLFHSPLSLQFLFTFCHKGAVYLRLLIFLPAILIPAGASSSLAFGMMYSEAKLNKQSDNIQRWRTSLYSIPNLEPVHCSMFGSDCCFLTCIQVSCEAGKVVWYSHLFKNLPQFVVIWALSLFFFMCLPKDLSLFFIFSKNQLLVSLIVFFLF